MFHKHSFSFPTRAISCFQCSNVPITLANLYGFDLTKYEWKECLKFASKAAAICCTKEGCYPPTEKEINKSRLTQK